jgi:hypothetical protein
MRDSKYIVDDSYTPYVKVAEKATEMGWKMNTATARHIFYRGLEKVAYNWLIQADICSPSEAKTKCKEVAKSLAFQHLVRDALEENDMNNLVK